MKWETGRQGTGYKKLKLFSSKRLECDCWLLRYDVGSYIPPHTDPVVEGKVHYRLNVVLKKAKQGGNFVPWGEAKQWWRFTLFRPDLVTHMVHEVREGRRYVLSIGWLKNVQ